MRDPAPVSDITQNTDAADKLSRRRWMATLARAATADLESCWQTHGQGNGQAHGRKDGRKDGRSVGYDFLRQPECGLVMVRGRAGGNGRRFNLGEMTVTRCSVRLADGTVGHAYVAGRDRRRAELAAAFDALLQVPSRHEDIQSRVIAPLAMKYRTARAERSRKAAATKVDFFTLVRGEDE